MSKETAPVIRHPLLRWIAGMAAGDVAIAVLYWGVGILLSALKSGSGYGVQMLIGWPSFFLVPMFGGLLASYVWRPLRPRVGATLLGALVMTLLGLAGAAVVFKEGVICLIIVSPLFFAMILAGALVGRVWFKVDPSLLRFSILPMVALMAMGEPLTRSEQTGVVTDGLLIHAPPSKVWSALTAFPEIPAKPEFWLFKLGLPYPQSTTTAGDFVGADRRCIFSGGAVFKESIAELVPRKNLTFDIIDIPRDPELMGHLTPTRGQFLLLDNGDGTTRLVGSTWYELHVRPLWYFDWWTQHIFRAVHLRVMEDIRRRAEAS